MAQLPDRNAVDGQLARALGKLNAKRRRQLKSMIGNPPDFSRVPDAWWQEVEDEYSAKILLFLYLIYLSTVELENGDIDNAEADADAYATAAAQTAASDAIRAMRDRLKQADAEYRKLRDELKGTGKVPKIDLDDLVVDVIRDTDAGRLARGAITRTQTKGTSDVSGYSDEDLWITMEDNRVCKYCRPLHLAPRSTWAEYELNNADEFPKHTAAEGPPAHGDTCRCYVRAARRNRPQPVTSGGRRDGFGPIFEPTSPADRDRLRDRIRRGQRAFESLLRD